MIPQSSALKALLNLGVHQLRSFRRSRSQTPCRANPRGIPIAASIRIFKRWYRFASDPHFRKKKLRFLHSPFSWSSDLSSRAGPAVRRARAELKDAASPRPGQSSSALGFFPPGVDRSLVQVCCAGLGSTLPGTEFAASVANPAW